MCCAKPQPSDEIGHGSSRSTGSGVGWLLVVALACCGAPLLLIALASGAIALSAVLIGAAALALAGAASLLLRPLVRRPAGGRRRGAEPGKAEDSASPESPARQALTSEVAGDGEASKEAAKPRAPVATR